VVTGELRRLHNKKVNDLNSSPDIFRMIESRRMRWAGHVARMGKRRGAYRVLVWIPERNRTLRRPRRRSSSPFTPYGAQGIHEELPGIEISSYSLDFVP
jgi:hypothetical protein